MTEPTDDPHNGVERTVGEGLWDCQTLEKLFTGHAKVTAPWPRAGRSKRGATFDLEAVRRLLVEVPDLTEVDPRTLYASQTWIVRAHVAYYLSGEWEQTGRTSADRGVELNRFPVIAPDDGGRRVILAGHHRAAAALIEGRPLLVRTPRRATRAAVTPLLFVDPTALPITPAAALDTIRSAERATVATVGTASEVLHALGLTPAEIDRAIGRSP